MSRIALIIDDEVANVIEADLDFAMELPGYDSAMEAGDAAPGWKLVEGALVCPPTQIPAQTLDDLRQQLRERATELRWQHETGGIEVGGMHVLTGIEDQNRIATVLIGAPATLDFKAASGWITLTIEQVQGIAAAITSHVQACFTAERAHHEAIDQLESIEDAQAYDVEAGWP